MNQDHEERRFDRFGGMEAPQASAPARLKSRIYSAITQREAQAGPLRDLTDTESEGRSLCVF